MWVLHSALGLAHRTQDWLSGPAVFREQRESLQEGVGQPHPAGKSFRPRARLRPVWEGESVCVKEGRGLEQVALRLLQTPGGIQGLSGRSPAGPGSPHSMIWLPFCSCLQSCPTPLMDPSEGESRLPGLLGFVGVYGATQQMAQPSPLPASGFLPSLRNVADVGTGPHTSLGARRSAILWRVFLRAFSHQPLPLFHQLAQTPEGWTQVSAGVTQVPIPQSRQQWHSPPPAPCRHHHHQDAEAV